MQDIEIWLAAVSTVGFPIVAFLLMFWFSTKVVRENTAALQELKTVLENRKG